ncbi:hypothetical protein [Prauserella muralis]|uniref:Uncharacterized protein n=1 Tax=Prauserella muralis TaxID=588067 RepID=A0A2V4B080_9PSEU|nr:hypothetical protein [Prauserella muralis]PXY27403.1 hypothetical protein BAY60_13290 [Prauserella muralis]TWE22901.1 hypothetical protein FHX69_4157 [Prauserella muralis]
MSETTTETPLHLQQAEGLEALAALIRNRPEIAETVRLALAYLNSMVPSRVEDGRGAMEDLVAAADATGIVYVISNDRDSCRVTLDFGPAVCLSVRASAERMAGQPAPPKVPAYEPLTKPGGAS